MRDKSEIIVGSETAADPAFETNASSSIRDLLDIAIVFALILAAVWTPQGRLNAFFSLSAAACVLVVAFAGRWGLREMGLAQPRGGAWKIFLAGALLCGLIWVAGFALRLIGLGYPIPWNRSLQYAIWALVQEFILQSIFFVRLESVCNSRRAVFWAASLYAVAHIPNPVLTLLSFFGGLLFCEFFRRWRNLFPLGIIHGALGITIAASLPDRWLHHMRVGIGYVSKQHW
jgi:Type II CAAX prenyl endopeptidase Rce1-like